MAKEADEVYESDFRLYELEGQLEEFGFLRVSKSFLIPLQKGLNESFLAAA